MSILTLNCGSSSVKYSVFDTQKWAFVCRGIVDRVGISGSQLQHKFGEEELIIKEDCPDHRRAVGLVLRVLTSGDSPIIKNLQEIQAVGHRVVHGGEKYAHSALVTDELIQAVEQMARLAPLHNPPNLAGIRAARDLLPKPPHVAVFDTAFHQTMSPKAYVYPLPYGWYQNQAIRRYGFHGTSHLYVSARAAVCLGKKPEHLRLITLHIGNGASAAAICQGKSIDTSMGFTPLEGLVMGTRCGSIDPAIPLFMMEREGLSNRSMDDVLNKKSGLLGITGRFSDRRDIQSAAAQGDARCQLAIEIEVYALQKAIGAYAAALGGLDALVFTAGVGENSAAIRALTLEGLQFLGIHIDATRNQRAVGGKKEEIISSEVSPVKVLVIPTNEELVIVEDSFGILQGTFGTPSFRYSFGS